MIQRTGHWIWDSNHLPAYDYQGGYPWYSPAKEDPSIKLPEDPCFLLGNYRITLFAHASGTIDLITGERGWARINQSGKNTCATHSLIHLSEPGAQNKSISFSLEDRIAGNCFRQIFGTGYARYFYRFSENALELTKTLAVKPSAELNGGTPAFLTSIILKNTGSAPLNLTFEEQLPVNYQMMHNQEKEKAPVSYCLHLLKFSEPSMVQADLFAVPEHLLLFPRNDRTSFSEDVFPPSVFLKAEAPGTCSFRSDPGKKEETLAAAFTLTLAPGETQTLRIVTGLCFPGDNPENIAEELFSSVRSDGSFSDLWKKKLPEKLYREPDDILRCEMLWNAYILEAMATYSRYFNETYIPQGSVYAYHLGQNASNRDHLQHCLPAVYTNPALARSCIRYAMKHTHPDGRIERQNIGFGYCDPGIYMESDPQLYLFYAVKEYLRVTGDYRFLEETVSCYPAETDFSDTVLHILIRHFTYLRDIIGKGKHGLIRMLNSDWSDSFFHYYSPNIYIHFAESHMNTAMALAVLPDLIRELSLAETSVSDTKLLTAFIAALSSYYKKLFDAFSEDMKDKTFAPRCYIGEHDEAHLKFGVDRLCLESQPFILQMQDFSRERKEKLYLEIRQRVMSGEFFGARTREVPLWSSTGAGEDGGIWFSHQGQLIAGIASFDQKAAMELLKSMSFHHFAERYPDCWVGHWTFADSIESSLNPREGFYGPWLKEPFVPFCAHFHAWMLYCYFLLTE